MLVRPANGERTAAEATVQIHTDKCTNIMFIHTSFLEIIDFRHFLTFGDHIQSWMNHCITDEGSQRFPKWLTFVNFSG